MYLANVSDLNPKGLSKVYRIVYGEYSSLGIITPYVYLGEFKI